MVHTWLSVASLTSQIPQPSLADISSRTDEALCTRMLGGLSQSSDSGTILRPFLADALSRGALCSSSAYQALGFVESVRVHAMLLVLLRRANLSRPWMAIQ